MSQNKTIFDYINSILYKKPIEYDKKIASGYMLLMWFSHDKDFLPICNRINEHLFKLNDEQVYNYLMDEIPKGRKFLKWIKKNKIKNDVTEVKNKYNLSKREAQLYES